MPDLLAAATISVGAFRPAIGVYPQIIRSRREGRRTDLVRLVWRAYRAGFTTA